MDDATLHALSEALAVIMRTAGNESYGVFGATARDLWVGVPGGFVQSPHRPTNDVDVLLHIPSWDDYDEVRAALESLRLLPSEGDPEYRLRRGAFILDLIPVGIGPNVDSLAWRRSDRVLRFPGIRTILPEIASVPTRYGAFRVIPPWALVALKMSSYLDSPHSRIHDLVDILWVLKHFDEDFGSSRRYDVIGESVFWEDSGAFLLGREIAARSDATLHSVVRLFLERSLAPYAEPIQQALREEGLSISDSRREEIERLLNGFARGFEATG